MMRFDNSAYLQNVEENRYIVQQNGGAENEPAAQNIFARIRPPSPIDLAGGIINSMFEKLFRPALQATSWPEFVEGYLRCADEFARQRYAAGLLYREANIESDAVDRGIKGACSMARLAQEPSIESAIETSWDTIQRANQARERIAKNPRIASRLTQQHREEYAAHCLNWAWGYGVGIAACEPGVGSNPEATRSAAIFMAKGARFAYNTFRKIEWDDMVPSNDELVASRSAMAAMGITL